MPPTGGLTRPNNPHLWEMVKPRTTRGRCPDMSLFGTPAVQSIAGLSQAERAATRGERTKANQSARRPRDGDRLDLEVQTAEAEDAVRGLSGNAHEETDEDRQKQDHYRPQQKAPQPERKPLDVQG